MRLEKLDAHGKEVRWDSIVVSLFDAFERKRQQVKVVQRSYRDTGDYIFKFSLMGGDIVLYSSIRIAIMLPGSAPNLCIGFVLSRQTRDFRRLWGAADF